MRSRHAGRIACRTMATESIADLIPLREASQRLGISREMVRRLLHRGELAYVQTALGRLFHPDDVERLRLKRESEGLRN